jgi:glycosyltransferase involved in cell wall biosynthesis
MNKSNIDVIIISYNRNDLMLKVLRTLKNQTIKNFNVIISDDGSNSLINPNDFPFIKKYIWNFDDGYHRVARLNEAIDYCVSEKVILLDDDCIPLYDTFLESYIKILNDYDVCRGKIRFRDGYDSVAWVSCANIGFRLKKLKKIGCFDVNYDGNYGFEDLDIGNLIKKKKLSVSPFIEGTTTNHHGKDYKDGDRSELIIGKNKKYYNEKWGKQ